MAREKHRSVTCDDVAAATVEGLDPSKPKQAANHPANKFHGGQPKSAPSSGRGNKTLGWFMSEQMFDKKMNNSASSSPVSKAAPTSLERMVGNGAIAVKGAEEKKRRGRAGRKGRRVDSATSPSEGSAPSEDIGDEKQKIVNDFKDDYWYYDVATDGYYYEQNGARGWRRRMPNGEPRKPDQQQLPSGEKNPLGVDPRTLALLQNAMYQSQPAYKYYDPNSDGYYYEMASVDGWRKRQPTRPASMQAPRLPTAPYQSYGAALARGQMPRNCILSDSSASSSASDDAAFQDLLLSALDEFPFDSPARPNTLGGAELLNGFNPDRFLEGLPLGEQKEMDMNSRTPVSSLKTSTSLLETPHPPGPPGPALGSSMWGGWQGIGQPAVGDEDMGMGQLLQDLQKIWQTPTPTV